MACAVGKTCQKIKSAGCQVASHEQAHARADGCTHNKQMTALDLKMEGSTVAFEVSCVNRSFMHLTSHLPRCLRAV